MLIIIILLQNFIDLYYIKYGTPTNINFYNSELIYCCFLFFNKEKIRVILQELYIKSWILLIFYKEKIKLILNDLHSKNTWVLRFFIFLNIVNLFWWFILWYNFGNLYYFFDWFFIKKKVLTWICLSFYVYLLFSRYTFIDKILIDLHNKYFYYWYRRWVIFLFTINNQVSFYYLYLWLVCLFPLFYFITYLILVLESNLYLFMVEVYRNFWALEPTTESLVFFLKNIYKYIFKFICLWFGCFYIEVLTFFDSFTIFFNLNCISETFNFILICFYLIIVIFGWKFFQIQQLILYSFLQFNFSKYIYYFCVFKLICGFFLVWNLLLFGFNLNIWSAYILFVKFGDFLFTSLLDFEIYLKLSLQMILELFIDLIDYILSFEYCLFVIILIVENIIWFIIYDCLLNFSYYFYENIHFIIFMPFVFVLITFWIMSIFFLRWFINPQIYLKYYTANFIQKYSQYPDKIFQRTLPHLDRAKTKGRLFFLYEVYEIPKHNFLFQKKSFYSLEHNLRNYFYMQSMSSRYENHFFRLEDGAGKKLLKYKYLNFEIKRLFNPFWILYLKYISLVYIRNENIQNHFTILKLQQKLLNDKHFKKKKKIVKYTHIYSKYLVNEFCPRFSHFMFKRAKKIAPIHFEEMDRRYRLNELDQFYPGISQLFYIYK